jgi:hypothetical protein
MKMMADETKESSCDQPNAHCGSSDLFRLGSPSQGILFFSASSGAAAKAERRPWSLEPEGCPSGSGGFSAFNLPGPGRHCDFELGISDFGLAVYDR